MDLDTVRELFSGCSSRHAQSSVFFPGFVLPSGRNPREAGGVNIVRILGLFCCVHKHARVDPYNSESYWHSKTSKSLSDPQLGLAQAPFQIKHCASGPGNPPGRHPASHCSPLQHLPVALATRIAPWPEYVTKRKESRHCAASRLQYSVHVHIDRKVRTKLRISSYL